MSRLDDELRFPLRGMVVGVAVEVGRIAERKKINAEPQRRGGSQRGKRLTQSRGDAEGRREGED